VKFLTTLDGSDRNPRPEQANYLKHLDKVWSDHRYFVLNAAPGLGKSMIARTINRTVPSSAIVTPSNQLVDQYHDAYPELIPLKGKEHYETPECYALAKTMANNGAPCVFNPISFFYHYLSNPDLKPNVVIIDEAHKLANLLVNVVSQTFHCNYYSVPLGLNDAGFLDWLSKKCDKLALVKDRTDSFRSQYERLTLLHRYLQNNIKKVKISYQDLPNYRTGVKEKHLCITPLVFPTDLLTTVFGDAKIIFMSGTMFPIHMKELGIEKYDYKEYNSACPIDNRRINIYPSSDRSDCRAHSQIISKAMEQIGSPNTIVHVPYSQQKTYKQHLPNALTHTKETKEKALSKFKKKGGILLASGMAEGVDLPGDDCRLLVIPKLLYPNLGDDAVKKRMLMPDGQTWYNMQTITTTIQQIYRGVRGPDDACVILILDPTFERLLSRVKQHLPKDFIRSISWG